MNYKKINFSTSTIQSSALFAAISALALVVSFMAASYLYARSNLIPYSVLLALSFILLELLVLVYFSTLSELANYLFRKKGGDVTESTVPAKAEQIITVPNKAEAPNSMVVLKDNVASVASEQEEPVSPKGTEEFSAPEEPLVVSQASVERSESITKLLNLSAEENSKKREKFIQGRKELMEAYIRGIMKPLLPEADIEALWLEYEQWIESSTYHPTGRMWKWKEKVTSRDVRHLTWNIAKRMGMENGYGTKTCARFIMTLFPELCLKRDGSKCTEEYLANNLLEEGKNDFIKIDKPDPNSIAFHFKEEKIKQKS